MKKNALWFLAIPAWFLGGLGCQSAAPLVVQGDPEHREELLGVMSDLEGRWEGQDPTGQKLVVTFDVIAAGSAVRETMFPGTEHEMTNMYLSLIHI